MYSDKKRRSTPSNYIQRPDLLQHTVRTRPSAFIYTHSPPPSGRVAHRQTATSQQDAPKPNRNPTPNPPTRQLDCKATSDCDHCGKALLRALPARRRVVCGWRAYKASVTTPRPSIHTFDRFEFRTESQIIQAVRLRRAFVLYAYNVCEFASTSLLNNCRWISNKNVCYLFF